MAKEHKKPAKQAIPGVQLISDEEYKKLMTRLQDIQIAANSAVKALNNLKAVLVTIHF